MTAQVLETSIRASLVSVPRQVIKRDGKPAPFDATKIRSAIHRAGQATGEFGDIESDLLSAQVVKVLIHKHRIEAPAIENIQDVVEQVLISANHFQTARAYIVYREQHKKLREDRKTMVDVGASINEYLEQQDWRVNANANQGYSLGGLILNVSGKVVANYWLNHVYPPKWAKRTATAIFTFTIWICWRVIARAGRCAPCSMKG